MVSATQKMDPKLSNGHQSQHAKHAAETSADAKLSVPQHNGERRMSAAAVFWSAGQQVSLDSAEQTQVSRAAGLSQQRSVLSTHVLDIATGKPAHGLHCKAYKWDRSHSEWTQIGDTVTNAQGRVPAVHPGLTLSRGTYKLRFAVKEYFAKQQLETMFPHIDVRFIQIIIYF
jgi:5-hydroxyisourate hydrolase